MCYIFKKYFSIIFSKADHYFGAHCHGKLWYINAMLCIYFSTIRPIRSSFLWEIWSRINKSSPNCSFKESKITSLFRSAAPIYNFLGLFEMNLDMLYLPNEVTANKLQYYFKPFDKHNIATWKRWLLWLSPLQRFNLL